MNAFIIMPFRDKISENLYRLSIKPLCQKLDLTVARADEIFSANPILDDIIGAIESAKVIIADLTGRNPNVFYELGISHTLKRTNTIVLTRDSFRKVPFDVSHFRIIKYSDSIPGKASFDHNLEQTLRVILADPRAHKADEFKQVVRMFNILDRNRELLSVVARRALAHSPDIHSAWWYEASTPEGKQVAAIALYDHSTFQGVHSLGYVEFSENTINFTPLGEAFADYLIQSGYRCFYINGRPLQKGYEPTQFIKEYEAKLNTVGSTGA